ncbi:TIGR01777 family oxidoreductase [Flexithrix dorotheae]|uniref:TIGR01777 family oxidoreductase n=1 Tax=Flexithrix dorotheae TaxID=70993 RepID=UPI000362D712|nr:TIGR01777 family oxidoreductase [Flexithrix dorotheae]
MSKINILITGGTGLIGSRLTELLLEKGHGVSYLSRSKKQGDGSINYYHWDPSKGEIDQEAIDSADYIIHLAGASVADSRWTDSRKKVILKSRQETARLLFDGIKNSDKQLKGFISASGIGYYGYTGDQLIDESASLGNDFLAKVCEKWEEESLQIKSLGIRTTIIRIGVVLSEKGGALKELMTPVKFFVGSPLGSGEQYMSWIHIDDLCKIFLKAVEDESMEGVYNGVAPSPVTNEEMVASIAKTLKRPVFPINVPGIALKILLGEMSEIVLKGSKVSSKKIEAAGFTFGYPSLNGALSDLLN